MKCIPFYNGEKKDEQKTKSLSCHSFLRSLTVKLGNLITNVTLGMNKKLALNPGEGLSSRVSQTSPVFSFLQLKAATMTFCRYAKIGEGRFGCVYKGTLKSQEDPARKLDVAVKQLSAIGLQSHKEWVTEVNVLGMVVHPNLVKLVGYCADQWLLVYEYMPNGSVEDHLFARSETLCSWDMRLKIAQDAARGLAYLHEEMDFQIIFRNFKSSNVLLDENWNAKLSNFGLARLGPSEGLTHVSTANIHTTAKSAINSQRFWENEMFSIL